MEKYPMLTPSCCYQVDAEDRIINIDGAWSAFARENGGQSLLNNPPIGRLIWDLIRGMSTRNIYHIIMKQVRKTGHPARFPFRCDSPDVRRYMEMKISLGEAGSLWFQTSIAKVVAADGNNVSNYAASPTKELVQMCAWCDRVQVGDEWLPLEVAIWSLGLLDTPEAPPISHDICLSCYNQLHKKTIRAKNPDWAKNN
jgi:hypothetical protein